MRKERHLSEDRPGFFVVHATVEIGCTRVILEPTFTPDYRALASYLIRREVQREIRQVAWFESARGTRSNRHL